MKYPSRTKNESCMWREIEDYTCYSHPVKRDTDLETQSVEVLKLGAASLKMCVCVCVCIDCRRLPLLAVVQDISFYWVYYCQVFSVMFLASVLSTALRGKLKLERIINPKAFEYFLFLGSI